MRPTIGVDFVGMNANAILSIRKDDLRLFLRQTNETTFRKGIWPSKWKTAFVSYSLNVLS